MHFPTSPKVEQVTRKRSAEKEEDSPKLKVKGQHVTRKQSVGAKDIDVFAERAKKRIQLGFESKTF